jgi:Na+/H+-dicarboxylate symporter
MSFLEELKKKVDAQRSPVTVVNRGVTPLSLLGIAFIVLKVMGQITWSWWWVLAPFWIPVVLAVTLLLFIILVIGIVASKEQKIVVEASAPKKKARTKKTKKEDGAGVEGKNG